MSSLPADFFVTSTAYTKTTHIHKYDTIDPQSAALSQTGKIVIITGANRGLGRKAFAPAFAKANAKAIVLVARSIDSLSEVEREIVAINPHVQILKAEADIVDQIAVEQVYALIGDTFGTADVLVNNAGVFASNAPISDAVAHDWWRDWQVNVQGTFQMTRGFLNLIGPSRPGSVINLTTSGSVAVYPNLSSYTISKLAATHLQRFVAAENPHITATALDPCLADTDLLLDDFRAMHLIDPELIGGSAVWLASDQARFMTGRVFNVTWDVEQLMRRKDRILQDNDLTFCFNGRLGSDQFA